jgi:hypothetical protein
MAAGASVVEIAILVWSLIVPQVYLYIDAAQINHNRRDKQWEYLIKPFAHRVVRQ